MKKMMTIETYDQLKALGDPLRSEIMMQLVMQPYTVQQLSELLNIPRGQIHYHLKNLEKNGLVQLVKTEEKNGILQKFYQAKARDFAISEKLLPHKKDVDYTTRQVLYSVLERAKRKVQTAPESSFETKGPDEPSEERKFMATTAEVSVTEKQFKQWKKKYYALLEELHTMGEHTTEETNNYYVFTLGLQVDE